MEKSGLVKIRRYIVRRLEDIEESEKEIWGDKNITLGEFASKKKRMEVEKGVYNDLLEKIDKEYPRLNEDAK